MLSSIGIRALNGFLFRVISLIERRRQRRQSLRWNANRSYRYHAYGLSVESSLEFPELPFARTPSDVQIGFGKVEPRPTRVDEAGIGFWADTQRACHFVRGVGAFLVSEGRSIVVDPDTAVCELLRLSILGPAMALVLHQRGMFVLHASAVAINGHAVAFLGGHAYGKSTMAAMLHARGYPMITDDVTAVSVEGNDPMVLPSFPQFKLWPDAARGLGLTADELPKLSPNSEKRALRFDQGFATGREPLSRLYLLAIGDVTMVKKIRTVEAFEVLLGNWYGSRFGSDFFKSIDLKAHFMLGSLIAREVPVRYLYRPASLFSDRNLPEAIETAILRDLADE